VARLLGPVIAFATAACLAIFIPFHGSGGWDYQNAAAGSYYIVAFYVLTVASLEGNPRALIWAGAAYAAAIHAELTFVNMIPILAIHYLTLCRYQFGRFLSWREMAIAVLWFLVGAVILTILLGLVNVAVGRNFLFFKELLGMAIKFVGNSQNQAAWWFPWSSRWFLDLKFFSYLRVIFAVLAACIAAAVSGVVRWRFNVIALSLQVQYIFIAVLWIAWQSVGQTALEPDSFAYAIYPTMFFGLAGLAATCQPAGRLGLATVLFYGSVAVMAMISLSLGTIGVALLRWTGQHVETVLALSSLLFVALFAASMGRPALMAVAVFAFCASNTLQAAATINNILYALHGLCKDRETVFRALFDNYVFLTRFVAKSGDMFVWWDENDVLRDQQGCAMRVGDFASSMVALGLQFLAPPWTGMPDVDELPASSISVPGSSGKVAVLTTNYSNVERLIARYDRSGVKLAVEAQTIIRTSHFSFMLYVLGPPQAVSGPTTMLQ
jgi:hypothetical protein